MAAPVSDADVAEYRYWCGGVHHSTCESAFSVFRRRGIVITARTTSAIGMAPSSTMNRIHSHPITVSLHYQCRACLPHRDRIPVVVMVWESARHVHHGSPSGAPSVVVEEFPTDSGSDLTKYWYQSVA
jgi:hypothetical protein